MIQREKPLEINAIKVSSNLKETVPFNETSKEKVWLTIKPHKSNQKLKFTKGKCRKLPPLVGITKYIHIGKKKSILHNSQQTHAELEKGKASEREQIYNQIQENFTNVVIIQFVNLLIIFIFVNRFYSLVLTNGHLLQIINFVQFD